jgi:hypothetical protein
MAVVKDEDRRMGTRGGGSIRVETWVDPKSGVVVEYNLAYVNQSIYAGDNGRVVGFDNRDYYEEFQSANPLPLVWTGGPQHQVHDLRCSFKPISALLASSEAALRKAVLT